MILLLLPLLALAGLCAGAARRAEAAPGALAEGLVRWSAIALFGAEALGRLGRLQTGWIAGFWLVVAAAALWQPWRSGARSARERDARAPGESGRGLLVLGLSAVIGLLALTVALAPPNEQDVVTYHLPRVLHWAQAGTLQPFPTHDTRQLYHPPLAEVLDLHTLLLSGGDRWVGPLRLLFLVAAATCAARVANQLRGGDPSSGAPRSRIPGLIAAALTITAPTTVVLVHGGKNSPMVGFFLLACASYLLSAWSRPTLRAGLGAGLSLGLAFATKSTSYVLGAPLLLLLGGALLLRHRARVLAPALLVALTALALNAGHYARNLSVFGHPLVDPARAAVLSIQDKGVGPTVSNALRYATLHLGLPSASWNAGVESLVRTAHDGLGLDPDDPDTTAGELAYSVDNSLLLNSLTGSPLHFLAISLGVLLVLVRPRLRANRMLLLYGLALVGAALFFTSTVRWTPVTARLMVPLLLLGAPLAANAWGRWPRFSLGLALLALVTSVPWIVYSGQRPLVGPRSVLGRPRSILLYEPLDWKLAAPVDAAARYIGRHGLTNVGLLSETRVHPEYPVWLALQEHVSDVRIEHVNVQGPAGKLLDRAPYRPFRPYVVMWISTFREDARKPYPEQVVVDGKPLVLAFSKARVALYTYQGG